MTQAPKVVGQPCPDCGEPYIQGKNGAYCKPCYIKWKNSQENKPQQAQMFPRKSGPFPTIHCVKCSRGSNRARAVPGKKPLYWCMPAK